MVTFILGRKRGIKNRRLFPLFALSPSIAAEMLVRPASGNDVVVVATPRPVSPGNGKDLPFPPKTGVFRFPPGKEKSLHKFMACICICNIYIYTCMQYIYI